MVDQTDWNLKTVVKTSRYEHDFNAGIFQSTLRDALVMERLTSSPRIVNIYGHCGATVWVEAIPYEVEEYIVPGDGYIKANQTLNASQELKPQNRYTPTQKLQMALDMSESLADLHGYKGGVM